LELESWEQNCFRKLFESYTAQIWNKQVTVTAVVEDAKDSA